MLQRTALLCTVFGLCACAAEVAGPVGVPHATGSDALARLDEACRGGSATACNNLGAAYASGRGAPLDVARGAELFARACDGGQLSGCYNLALALADGRGVARDEARANALFERACAGGVGYACTSLAMMTRSGRGARADIHQVVSLLERGCDARDAGGCLALARLYLDGAPGLAKDAARAAGLYTQACRDGSSEACSNLGALYAKGLGVVQSDRRAVALFRHA